MSFQSACFGGCIFSDNLSQSWHLLDFVNCVFECVFNLHVGEDAKSHWLNLFVFSPARWALNVPEFAFITVNLSNASSNCLPEGMQHHIGYSYFTFPHSVFFSTCILKWTLDSPRVCNIATITVFVKTFLTLCFDMSPKITYLSRYIKALVAFV